LRHGEGNTERLAPCPDFRGMIFYQLRISLVKSPTSPWSKEKQLHGGFEFSEGASAKWIFDVENGKLRAYFFSLPRRPNIVEARKIFSRSFETNIL
jgi:hypothetical protein